MKHKKYLIFIITFLFLGSIVFAADLKQLAEQLVNLSIQPFEERVYFETSTGTRFTSCDEAKAWNEKITALEKEGIALKKEMEKKRDEFVLKVEKSQRVEFLDNFNKTIFPRLNRAISSLKEVPLSYYCNGGSNNSGEAGEVQQENDSEGDDEPTLKEGSNDPIPGIDVIVEKLPDEQVHNNGNNEDDQAQKRMATERRAAARNIMDENTEPHMGLREGSEDPIPGIDVIVERDPSAIPVHFDGSVCLDCGEEPVRLSDKTSEILVKAMPIIQKEGWKLELKKVDAEKYPKGTQAPAIPAKKVESKKLFGLFGVEVEVKAEINPQGEIQNIDKPWWSFLAW